MAVLPPNVVAPQGGFEVENEEQGTAGLVAVLGALTALAPLTIDAYLPALPAIERDFGANPGAAAMTLASFFVGLAGAQLFWGVVSDRVGRRAPLLVGLILFVLATMACAWAPNLAWLTAARFAQGVAGASSIVITRALTRDFWSGAQMARVLSLVMLVMGVAPVLAPPLGGLLLTAFSWRAIFHALAVAGALGLLLAVFTIPGSSRARATEPVLPGLRAVLADRRFMLFSLSLAAGSSGLFAYISGSPSVFIEQFETGSTVYSVIFGFNAAGLIVLSQWNRAMLKKRSPLRIVKVALVVQVLAALGLTAVAVWAPSVMSVEALLFVFLAVQGLVFPNLGALALDGQGARAGLASAVMGTLQFAVSALASASMAWLANGTPVPMAVVMLGCALVAAVLLFAGARGGCSWGQ